MDEVQVPAGLRGPRENGSSLAVGPFALTHNGALSIGLFLEFTGDEYVLSDGARDYLIDESYEVRTTRGSVTFYSDEFKSKFVLRPLTQSDVEWIHPGEGEIPIEDVKMRIATKAQTYGEAI